LDDSGGLGRSLCGVGACRDGLGDGVRGSADDGGGLAAGVGLGRGDHGAARPDGRAGLLVDWLVDVGGRRLGGQVGLRGSQGGLLHEGLRGSQGGLLYEGLRGSQGGLLYVDLRGSHGGLLHVGDHRLGSDDSVRLLHVGDRGGLLDDSGDGGLLLGRLDSLESSELFSSLRFEPLESVAFHDQKSDFGLCFGQNVSGGDVDGVVDFISGCDGSPARLRVRVRNDLVNIVVDGLDLRRSLDDSPLREVQSVADHVRSSASDEVVVEVPLDEVVSGLGDVAQDALALVVRCRLGGRVGRLGGRVGRLGGRVGFLVRSDLSLRSGLAGLRRSLAALRWAERLLLACLVWRKVSKVDGLRWWRIHFWQLSLGS